MATASVRANCSAGTSGAMIVGVIALVMSTVGVVSSTVLAVGVSLDFLVPETASWHVALDDWVLLGFGGMPVALVGGGVGVLALLMAESRRESARAAKLAVVFACLSIALQVVTFGLLVRELLTSSVVS